MHLIKKYSLVTSRKKLPLNYGKAQHQRYKPPGLLLAGWKRELFSLSNLFFTAVMLFLSSFNATMHINCLLPSHKLYYVHYNYRLLDRARSHICLMLFPSSVLPALNVDFSPNSSPRSCFLLPFGLHSWSFQLEEKRWGGRLAPFTAAACSLLLFLTWDGKSTSAEYILSQRIENTATPPSCKLLELPAFAFTILHSGH